mmetsp:Transcript_4819/g.7496  ORF Transcript_4819/g.7496 Transcript_4819/m.7496 type:complete len:444 (+) Transcript_4819:134-1465(+)
MQQGDEASSSGGGIFSGFARALTSTISSGINTGIDYLPSSVKSYLGYENLEVVNPDGTKTVVDGNTTEQAAQKKEIFSKLSSLVGSDVLSFSLSLPVYYFEPTTTLQRQAEVLEYAQLLDKAAAADDFYDRLSLITAFAISAFSSTERTLKPFNPILGETFEYAWPDKKTRFVSEQVSHHPPIGASHCEGELWEFNEVSSPRTKFYGNAIEIYTEGSREIRLKNRNERYTWTTPMSCVHNLIVGTTWIEHYGIISVSCDGSKAKAEVDFKQCGWGGEGWHELEGSIFDEEGNTKIFIDGRWDESVIAQRVVKDVEEGEPVVLWTADPKPESSFKFSNFTLKLNGMTPEYEKVLPPTDSRLRPDRLALEKGDMSVAGTEKSRMEEKQRTDKRLREDASVAWTPRWFKKAVEKEQPMQWMYAGEYWEKTRSMSAEEKKKIELFSS